MKIQLLFILVFISLFYFFAKHQIVAQEYNEPPPTSSGPQFIGMCSSMPSGGGTAAITASYCVDDAQAQQAGYSTCTAYCASQGLPPRCKMASSAMGPCEFFNQVCQVFSSGGNNTYAMCVDATVTRVPTTPSGGGNCVNGASCTTNSQCSGAPYGGSCHFDGTGGNGRCQCLGEPPGSSGPSCNPGFSACGSVCCSNANPWACINNQCINTTANFVTIQGRLVGANGTTQTNIPGQGVSIAGLGIKTTTPWDYSNISTGSRTVVFNQVPGYTTRYRCNQGNCNGISSTFTAGTQVTVSLPNGGNYIDLYVQYVAIPTHCESLTKNGRVGDGGVPASGTIGLGQEAVLLANIVDDDGNHSNSSWSSTCGTFPSTAWDYATYRAPNTPGSCMVSYTLNGQNQPACTATLTVGNTCTGTTGSQTVSGTIRADTGGNNCADGGSAYADTAPIFTLRSGVEPRAQRTYDTATNAYSLNDTLSCSSAQKTVTISNLPAVYRVTNVRFNNGVWTTTPLVNSTAASLSGNSNESTTLDWCVSTASSWFQTDSGDVRFASNLSNNVPSGQRASTDTTSPGIFFSSDDLINSFTFGQGSVSDKGWKVSDEYAYNDSSRQGLGSMSYSFYKHQTRVLEIPVASLNPTANIGNLSTGIYEYPAGDITISAPSGVTIDGPSPNGKHIVLLVPGNAIINGPIILPPNKGNLFVLAVKGNITINPVVGRPPSDTTSSLDGYYSAEGSIRMTSGANCAGGSPDLRLNVSGAFIANALRPFAVGGLGKVQNSRTLCGQNSQYPSLFVSSRPAFLTQLSDFYKTTYRVYTEVSP